MRLEGRIAKLEAGAGFGQAPHAVWVYEGPAYSYAYLWDTREWLPYAEYDRRWPQHPHLKAYTDRRMVNPLDADWDDAPPPRSSADAWDDRPEEDDMGLQQRLAKLEQTRTGDAGAGVWGVASVHHLTQTGPDVVAVGPTGERLTRAAFRERYPRGLLVERLEYGDAVPTGGEAA